MRIVIILGCLVALSLAQGYSGSDAVDTTKKLFDPILCALRQLSIPIDLNLDLSFLIGPLNDLLEVLKTNLGKISDLSPENQELTKLLESIESILQDIISTIQTLISELEENPRASESLIETVRAILIDVVKLFIVLEQLIIKGLSLGGDSSDIVETVSNLVADSIGQILSTLSGALGDVPVLGDIVEAFNDQLFPIINQVVTTINRALSVPFLGSLGLGRLISTVLSTINNLLGAAITPIVDSILPSNSSACLGDESKSSASPVLNSNETSSGLVGGVLDMMGNMMLGSSEPSDSGAASNVINMLGSMVSSPVSLNIDNLLDALASSANPSSDTFEKTMVNRPTPDLVCIPVRGTRPEIIQTLNSSLGMPLIDLALQLTPGKDGDLGKLIDLLAPLLRVLSPAIKILRELPIGELGEGLLNPLLQILQSLVSTLTGSAPLDADQIVSRLLRALVLLIGLTAVGGGDNPVLSRILRSLLLSLGLPILSLLGASGAVPADLFKALSQTLNSLGGDVGDLIGQLPTENGGGDQESGSGGGVLGVVGGLVGGLLDTVLG